VGVADLKLILSAEVLQAVEIPVFDTFPTAKANLFKLSQLEAVVVVDHKPILSAEAHPVGVILA